MRRVPERWATPLGRWVARVGVQQVVKGLRERGHPLTAFSVYKWIAGRTQPRPDAALALVDLSEGRLSLGDLVHHPAELARARYRGRQRHVAAPASH